VPGNTCLGRSTRPIISASFLIPIPFVSRFTLLLRQLRSPDPAQLLIRNTARQEWRLLTLNLGSSLVQAVTEGLTLAVIFMAVEALSQQGDVAYSFRSNPIASRMLGLSDVLGSLPREGAFAVLMLIAVLMQALQSLAFFVNTASVGALAARCTARVTAAIHHQVMAFSFPCASSYRVGKLMDCVNQGVLGVQFEIEYTGGLLVSCLLVLTYIVVLLSISPWLLLAVAALVGVVAVLQGKLRPLIRNGSRQVSSFKGAISEQITEDFQGLRLLHSMGQLEEADHSLQRATGQLAHAMQRQALRLAVLAPITNFLPVLAIAIIAIASLLLFQNRSSGIFPSLVTFVLGLQRLNSRLGSVTNALNNLSDNHGRVGQLNVILDSRDKELRRVGGKKYQSIQSAVIIENVSLRYGSDLPFVLNNVSFQIPKGRMVALVGPSGAGKSSLVDLLTGLYRPTSGIIRIDDISLDKLDLLSWQQRLGVVSQDTFLFNASIADNVSFGTPGSNLADVKEACEAAQASRFIEAMPEGYETVVGERGYRLSGGQRQRISLARAILRNPDLLILDEATSALDTQSERLVQEAIERFERNHTVLVIAHRLSTIVNADLILVLEKGSVVERGTHDELLRHGSTYSSFWNQQASRNGLSHMQNH
jgi:ATP-binding cassette subfamily B protein/subfamily B ATP-binding cassette protein MsbA